MTRVHENQSYLPPLSEFGNLRLGKKSDLITCVQLEIKYLDPPSTYDCNIFAGAAMVHALPVTTVSTFGKYADSIFIAFIVEPLQ